MGRIVRSVLLQTEPLLLALLLLLELVVLLLLAVVLLLLLPVVLLLLEPVVLLLLPPELLLALVVVVVVLLLALVLVVPLLLVVPALLELVVVAALLPPLADPELLVAAPPAPLEPVGEPVDVEVVGVLAPVPCPPPVPPEGLPQPPKMLVTASIASATDRSMKRTLRWWSMGPPAYSTSSGRTSRQAIRRRGEYAHLAFRGQMETTSLARCWCASKQPSHTPLHASWLEHLREQRSIERSCEVRSMIDAIAAGLCAHEAVDEVRDGKRCAMNRLGKEEDLDLEARVEQECGEHHRGNAARSAE
jgi:hypothetical protein